MSDYEFYFAPEGRMVAKIRARSLTAAKAAFYAQYPAYRKAKGEIYWVVVPLEVREHADPS